MITPTAISQHGLPLITGQDKYLVEAETGAEVFDVNGTSHIKASSGMMIHQKGMITS